MKVASFNSGMQLLYFIFSLERSLNAKALQIGRQLGNVF